MTLSDELSSLVSSAEMPAVVADAWRWLDGAFDHLPRHVQLQGLLLWASLEQAEHLPYVVDFMADAYTHAMREQAQTRKADSAGRVAA